MSRRMTVEVPAGSESFNELVDRHGPSVMIAELLLLGIGTFGAIAYDQRLDAAEAEADTEAGQTTGTVPADENDSTEQEAKT